MEDTEPKRHKSIRNSGRVTMAAVGRMAGVSQVTVSRALSEPSKVSPATLRRIQEAIEVTGFVPNALAGALASQQSYLISALVPSLTNIVYSAVIKTFSDRMREARYQILLSETGFDLTEEERLIEAHLSRRPDAMLLTGIRHTAQARRMLLGADIPVVEVWDMTDTPIDMCVGFSHAETARAAADFAAGLGHRVAGTITANDERAQRRRKMFAERFISHGGTVAAHECGGPASIAAGRAGLSDLLNTGELVRGILFCSSDVLAHGAMIEAHARKLRIPYDIAIIGFGDQEFAAHVDPALTTVRVDRDMLGKASADAILSRIHGSTEIEQVTDLGFTIIKRDST